MGPIRARLAQIAREYRIPVVSEDTEFARAGGLLAYGVNHDALHRRAAWFVDQILQGTPIRTPRSAWIDEVREIGYCQDATSALPLGPGKEDGLPWRTGC